MKCTVCEVVTSWPKQIMSTKDKFEKYMGEHMGKSHVECDIPNKGLKKKWHLLTRTSNMFVILFYSMFTSLCQFFNNLTMLWLGRIDVRLFNLPPFSMFCKMGGPCLTMRFCNSCFNLWTWKFLPKKHWNDAFGWEMGEHIHAQIWKVLKVNVMGVWYLSIKCDELTSIHNHH
jgi:hypothetical protein